MSDHGLRTVFAQGQTVFTEGELGERAFLIERGQVDISFERRGRPVRIASLGAGEIFGEMALIDDRPRSATAVAAAETEAVVIRRDQIQMVLRGADPTLSLLLRVLLGRFRSMQGLLDAMPDPNMVAAQAEAAPTTDSAAIDRLRMEEEIAQAMEREDFDLLLQPIVSMHDGGVAGFETLLRWRHPTRGLVPPNILVQLAESSALIRELDQWVIASALQRLRVLQDRAREADRPAPFISINLSGASFADDAEA
ncbi:MAG: EAL domain-containing protein, partial [Pseudomonadota bacterium]